MNLRNPAWAVVGIWAAACWLVPAWALAAGNAAPQASDPSDPADTYWLHQIEPGDTLIGLRDRLMRPGADWRVVQRINRIANPQRLRVGSTLRIPLALLRSEPASAEVLHRHGEVWLERVGAARQSLAAAAVLYSGDVVVTGPQSSVSLRFMDGSRTLLGPDSRLRLDRLARMGAAVESEGLIETQLRLESGGAESKVQSRRPAPRFEIRTPAVNLGVRGTDFRGRVDGSNTWVEVLEGRVAAAAQPVAAGFGTVATAQGVAAPQALLGAPDLSALPAQVRRLPLQLPWAAAPGAQRYRAQVFAVAGDAAGATATATGSATGSEPAAAPQPALQLVLEGVFDQPTASWVDELPDGRYTLRVRAADASGIEGQVASHDFVLDARPQPPFLLRPRAGDKLETDNVTLAWSRNPEAVRYRIQISQQPDFSTLVFENAELTGAEASATLLPLGTYHWRVASIRADGKEGPFSDALSFERITPPPPAPGTEPARKSDAGIVVSWGASPLAGSRYQVQIARDAAFSDIVLDETVTTTEQLLAAPAPGTYHVRVRTIGADGRSGGFGSVQIVDVPRSNWWLWLLPLLLLL